MKYSIIVFLAILCSCQISDSAENTSKLNSENDKVSLNTKLIENTETKIDTLRSSTLTYNTFDHTDFYQLELRNSLNDSKVRFDKLSNYNIKELKQYLDIFMFPKEYSGEIEKSFSDAVGDFLLIKLHEKFQFTVDEDNTLNFSMTGDNPFYFMFKNCEIKIGVDSDHLQSCGLTRLKDVYTKKDYFSIYLSPSEQSIVMNIDMDSNRISNIRLRTNI
jgi:hypothetical protein